MADIAPSTYSSPWLSYIYPKQPSSPVSGNALATGTQALNSMGSPNLQSPASTGFAASSQGPTGGSFNPQASVPESQASQNATGQSINNVQNAATGNTQQASNALLSQQSSPTGVFNGTSQGGGGSASGQQQGNTGLPGNLFQTAVSKLAGEAFTGIGSAVNTFGAGLGFGYGGAAGTGSLAAETISPGLAAADASLGSLPVSAGAGLSSAGTATGASLSGTLGAAGLGFIGCGLLANAMGLNSTGGSIGGAIGAGAGMAIGASSAYLGAQIGAAAGPVGALVGGVAGAIFGGMFGPGKATSDSEFLTTNGINPNGSFETSIGTKNASPQAAQQLSSGIGAMLQGASSSLGIKFSNDYGVSAGVNTLHSGGPSPGFIEVGKRGAPTLQEGAKYFFDPSDQNSVADANFQALTYLAKTSGYTDTTALHNWFYGSGTPGDNPNNVDLNANNITIAPRR